MDPLVRTLNDAFARAQLAQAAIARLDAGLDASPAAATRPENVELRREVKQLGWQLSQATAAIERVEALHHRVEYRDVALCDGCARVWPCPTIRALHPPEETL